MTSRAKLSSPRELVLNTATHLFGEKGYAGTTMRDIATVVGVLPGSLYAHIDSKETLLLEIVDEGIDRFLEFALKLAASPDPAEIRLRSAIKEHLRVVAESPERTLVVFHQWRYLTGANRARIVDKRRRYERSFTRMIDDGMASGAFNKKLDRRIAVLTILGALNWTPEWFSPKGRASADEIGDALATTLLSGVLRNDRRSL